LHLPPEGRKSMASLGQARTVCWPAKPLTVLDLEAPFVSPSARHGKSKSAAPETGRRPRGNSRGLDQIQAEVRLSSYEVGRNALKEREPEQFSRSWSG